MLCYSPKPARVYSVPGPVLGTRLGLGATAADNPALWNLFWLSYPEVDGLLMWDPDDWESIPIGNRLMFRCEKTLPQILGGRTVSALVLELPAKEFVAHVQAHDYQHLEVYKSMGASWLPTIQQRALESPDAAQRVENVLSMVFRASPRVTEEGKTATIMTLPWRRDPKA